MKKTRKTIKIMLVVGLMYLPLWLIAQGPDFGDDGDQVYDVEVPFDGGVTLLIAAGIGYGIKNARDRRKKG